MSVPLVLLHGFTGAPDSWLDVRDPLEQDGVFVPALIGHDGTAGPAGIETFADEVDRLAAAVRARGLDRPHVAGYSMGGRVALGLLVRHPALFRGATLIGSNPGLRDRAGREARARSDAAWARLLEAQGLPTFVAAWEELPLFGTQARAAAAALARQRRIRLSHDPVGLARCLRVIGLAAMPDYRPDLDRLDLPVRLVVGAEDEAFLGPAREMARRLRRAELHIIRDAGHNVVLERPAEIARLLKELEP